VLPLLLVLALARPAAAGLPDHGVLVPFRSLAGVRLGDTPAQVEGRLGTRYQPCARCARATWYYTRTGTSPGLAVAFRQGRVSAVSTLGAPIGWRTSDGLRVGEGLDRLQTLYAKFTWRTCVGYGALSLRRASAVTAIYTTADVVYGFGLLRPVEPICR
jgi:hypothetical protein